MWISQLVSNKPVWILGFIYMGLRIKITVYLSSLCVSLSAHTSMVKWIAEIYEQKSHENWNGLRNKLLTVWIEVYWCFIASFNTEFEIMKHE